MHRNLDEPTKMAFRVGRPSTMLGTTLRSRRVAAGGWKLEAGSWKLTITE
jgi:hypothetical protein